MALQPLGGQARGRGITAELSLNLGWDDLLIQDVADDDIERWLAEWRGIVAGPIAVAFLNKFGVWFLRRPDGPVDMLDVFSGDVERVADTYEALVANVNERVERLLNGVYSVVSRPGGGGNPNRGT